MKEIMERNNLTGIDELRKIKPVALSCKLCVPYILKMIETGETKFDVLQI